MLKNKFLKLSKPKFGLIALFLVVFAFAGFYFYFPHNALPVETCNGEGFCAISQATCTLAGGSGANLSWSAWTGGGSFNIYYVVTMNKAGETTTKTYSSYSNSVGVSGLSSNTNYEWDVAVHYAYTDDYGGLQTASKTMNEEGTFTTVCNPPAVNIKAI